MAAQSGHHRSVELRVGDVRIHIIYMYIYICLYIYIYILFLNLEQKWPLHSLLPRLQAQLRGSFGHGLALLLVQRFGQVQLGLLQKT